MKQRELGRSGVLYPHRVDPQMPMEDVAGAVKDQALVEAISEITGTQQASRAGR